MFDSLLNGFKGILRTTGGLIGLVGSIAMALPLPQAQIWGTAAATIGGIIAGVGTARAGAAYVVDKIKK